MSNDNIVEKLNVPVMKIVSSFAVVCLFNTKSINHGILHRLRGIDLEFETKC